MNLSTKLVNESSVNRPDTGSRDMMDSDSVGCIPLWTGNCAGNTSALEALKSSESKTKNVSGISWADSAIEPAGSRDIVDSNSVMPDWCLPLLTGNCAGNPSALEAPKQSESKTKNVSGISWADSAIGPAGSRDIVDSNSVMPDWRIPLLTGNCAEISLASEAPMSSESKTKNVSGIL